MNLLIITIFSCVSLLLHAKEEKPMVIVIPSYNNAKWCRSNLSSILNQKYSNYRIIYIDDHSSDETRSTVEELIKRNNRPRSYQSIFFNSNKLDNILDATQKFQEKINTKKVFFTLISNQQRCGALANQYRAISSCQDEEIVVLIDGDDWLAHDNVLQQLNEIYSSHDIWMTHGSLVEYPSLIHAWCEEIPSHIISSNTFREFKCPTHLRTFYASIFKKIKLEDLLYEGNFFSMTGDMAIMYPIIEMCGNRHQFISDPIYIYNMQNPINDNKVNAELQRNLDRYIREKKPYQKLSHR